MSMILDALSRAERERRQEQPHVLDTGRYVPSSSIKEDRYRKWVFIALLVNFILIIALLLGYLWNTGAFSGIFTDSDSVQAPMEQSVPTHTIKPPIVTSQLPKPPAEPSTPGVENSSLLNEAQVAKQPAPSPKKTLPRAVSTVPPVSYSSKPIIQNKKPGIPVEQLLAVKQSPASSDYMLLTDLAPAQRSKLNDYEVNVHVYDENPQKSFVLINMTKYKEGDKLPGGSESVNKIVPQGVIIDFGGGRVLIERN